MYAWSRELNYPVMAGSSIPLTKRSPRLEIPYDAQIENALTLGYGELDAYGFHTLEALQYMVERRKGGKPERTGVIATCQERTVGYPVAGSLLINAVLGHYSRVRFSLIATAACTRP